jgi:glycine/D-amino acid oxidase-like deaminating enzyme
MSENRSIWQKEIIFPPRDILCADDESDVIIIGAGMAGILTAHLLAEQGIESIIVESGATAGGNTAHTTAKITSLHGFRYARIARDFGIDAAVVYGKANQSAIREYHRIIAANNIDCTLREENAYIYAANDSDVAKPPSDFQLYAEMVAEQEIAEMIGLPAQLLAAEQLPFPAALPKANLRYPAALRFANQASFNPLAFLSALTPQLNIYEHSRAIDIEINSLTVLVTPLDNEHEIGERTVYKLRAKKAVVLACHFPIVNTGIIFARAHQECSYVVALAGARPVNGMYLGINRAGMTVFSLREYQAANGEKLLLLTGAAHRSGQTPEQDPYETLRETARFYFPEAAERAHWSAQDVMTCDGIPYIGSISPDVYVATGFNKWGMTGAMTAAMLIRDDIMGRHKGAEPHTVLSQKQRYLPVKKPLPVGRHKGAAAVFSPARFKLGAVANNVLTDISTTITNWLKASDADMEIGAIINMVDNSTLQPAPAPRCTHMGCRLAWNTAERTWDCPCHGSRFDEGGMVINAPAKNSLEIIP